MPGRDRQLAGDQDRTAIVPILDDFHQVAALACGQSIRPPVIEDEQVGLHQGPEQARKAAATMGKVEVGEEARQALVDDGEVITAGALTGNPPIKPTS